MLGEAEVDELQRGLANLQRRREGSHEWSKVRDNCYADLVMNDNERT